MNTYYVYNGDVLIAGPLASREGAYLECLHHEDADRVTESDVMGAIIEEIDRHECAARLRKIPSPR
jgi:hypothetical protein